MIECIVDPTVDLFKLRFCLVRVNAIGPPPAMGSKHVLKREPSLCELFSLWASDSYSCRSFSFRPKGTNLVRAARVWGKPSPMVSTNVSNGP